MWQTEQHQNSLQLETVNTGSQKGLKPFFSTICSITTQQNLVGNSPRLESVSRDRRRHVCDNPQPLWESTEPHGCHMSKKHRFAISAMILSYLIMLSFGTLLVSLWGSSVEHKAIADTCTRMTNWTVAYIPSAGFSGPTSALFLSTADAVIVKWRWWFYQGWFSCVSTLYLLTQPFLTERWLLTLKLCFFFFLNVYSRENEAKGAIFIHSICSLSQFTQETLYKKNTHSAN